MNRLLKIQIAVFSILVLLFLVVIYLAEKYPNILETFLKIFFVVFIITFLTLYISESIEKEIDKYMRKDKTKNG